MDCFQDLGDETLPGSTTTNASAIILLVSFLTTYGLSWCALDDQLRLIDTLFGSKENMLPNSKFLFCKIWALKAKSSVQHHYYCNDCIALLDLAQDSFQLTCPPCSKTSTMSAIWTKGCFFSILDIILGSNSGTSSVEQKRKCTRALIKLKMRPSNSATQSGTSQLKCCTRGYKLQEFCSGGTLR